MPPDDLITLDQSAPVEVRSLERRELAGRVFPYGVTINVRGRSETFTRGSLAGLDLTRTRLLRNHDQRQPLGRMIALEERDDGAYAVFRVSRTGAGDEALALASDGVLELSPGFMDGDLDGRHRRVTALPEVSLVTFAAYPQPQLTVRERETTMPEPTAPAPTAPAPAPAPDPSPATVPASTGTGPTLTAEQLEQLQTRQDELTAAIQRLEATAAAGGTAPAPTIRPLEYFRALVQRHAGNAEPYARLTERFEELQTRALADVTGGETGPGDNDPADDLSGLVLEEFVGSQLVNVLDARRPLFRSFGSFPAIRSGFARIPVVTQHVLVDDRGAQKTEVPSQAPIVTTQPFEAQWGAGAVDVALELIRTAELPVLGFIWEDFLGQYAKWIESKSVDLVESDTNGFTYTGAELPVDSYENFIAAVVPAALDVREATDLPATRLAVTRDQWIALVGLIGTDGARVFSQNLNRDASVTLTAESLSLPGGIEVFYVPNITRAYAYNEAAIRAVDYGPERFDALNVALMGRDVGLLGRYMIVPRIPAGVQVFDTEPE